MLFINPGQFGYKAAYYYYYKYLKYYFDITFICRYRKLKKVTLDGVNVKNISFEGNIIKRKYKWLKIVIKDIKNNNYDLIFFVYFKLCFIIGLLFVSLKAILDIRTASIKNNRFNNFLQTIQLQFE